MTTKRRSWWGWGWEDDALSDEECVELAGMIGGLDYEPIPAPSIDDLHPHAPRISAPDALAGIVSTAVHDRAAHTYGKAYRDVVRALRGELDRAPDLVGFPRSESDVVAMLDWAAESNIAVVPFGGGSSVVGGVEYRGDTHAGVLTLDTTRLDKVLEVDTLSRAARIQAGVFGPAVEEQLRPHGYTLRHYPQSFEFSTLGGWLATRSAGHYATGRTHIDEFVESMRVVSPSGVAESWRLPASGAGPSPDRMFLGSEGVLGVVTEAWMRVQARPRYKESTTVTFESFEAAVGALREIAQSGVEPSNARLLDTGEAALSGAGDGSANVLVLGMESAVVPVRDRLAVLVEMAPDRGGTPTATEGAELSGSADVWRSAFLRMPYIRDGLARMSAVVETFETATTWDRVGGLVEQVRTELGEVIERVCGAPGMVNRRFTHAYPDGAAPYFTVVAPGRRGSELAQWDEIKAAACEILHRNRATITHHHAVGRDHLPYYERQRPDPFAAALRAGKRALDPHGVLNPGTLLDP